MDKKESGIQRERRSRKKYIEFMLNSKQSQSLTICKVEKKICLYMTKKPDKEEGEESERWKQGGKLKEEGIYLKKTCIQLIK